MERMKFLWFISVFAVAAIISVQAQTIVSSSSAAPMPTQTTGTSDATVVAVSSSVQTASGFTLGGTPVPTQTPAAPPTVTIDGSNVTRVSLSDTVELSVTIESTEPVDVQWLFLFETPVNESLITNAESNGAIVRSTLTLRNISRDQLGLYFITVSSSAGQDGVSITVELNIPSVRFSESEYNVDEGKGYARLTAHLSFALPDDLTIQVYTQDGTATGAISEAEEFEGSGSPPDHNVDYVSGNFSMTFDAGTTQATLSVIIQDDFIAEGNHDFQVFFDQSSFGGAVLLMYNSPYTTVTITECMHRDKEVSVGERVNMECGSGCVCNHRGQLVCKTQLCTYDGPTCRALGDPHYITYDSYSFLHHFQGTCEYVLTKPCDNDDYVISAKNFAGCGRPGVSCIGLVRVRVPGENFEIVMERVGRRMTLTADGVTRNVPFYFYYTIHSSPTVDVFRIGWRYVHVFLKTYGVRMSYDFFTSVRITVSTPLMGKVCGLCGTYNGDVADDFTTPSGDVLPLYQVNEFGDSWEIEGSCGVSRRNAPGIIPDLNCTSDPNVTADATERCGMLRRGIFSLCNDVIDPSSYIETCEFDYCCCTDEEREECFCSAIASYASACADEGISLSSWRSADVCPPDCPEGMVYQECGPLCQQSCDNLNETCEGGCAEGCFCPDGEVLIGQSCVDPSRCDVCPAGYYGEMCDQPCACGDEGNGCNYITGNCTCNMCWEGDNCSARVGSDCLEAYLRVIEKTDDDLVPLPPGEDEMMFISGRLEVETSMIGNLRYQRVMRTGTRNLLKISFTVIGSMNQVAANDGIQRLRTLVKSGDWRATLITKASRENSQDTDVTINA